MYAALVAQQRINGIEPGEREREREKGGAKYPYRNYVHVAVLEIELHVESYTK